MLDSLFGQEMPLLVKGILAFVIVLALMMACVWLVRRFGGTRLGTPSARGRQPPRLAVIDTVFIEGRRRLALIRRDNVEHLILIGGPTDVVIEQNIVRAVPVAQPRDAAGRVSGGEPMPRVEGPRAEPRPAAGEPGWSPEPRGPRPSEPTWTPAPEPVGRSGRPPAEPRVPQPEPAGPAGRGAPEGPRVPAKLGSREAEQPMEMRQSPPTADVNLADMAQRLEAALRRPAARPPEPTDTPRPEPVRPEPARPEPTRGEPTRGEPTRAEPRGEPVRAEPKPKPAAEAPRPPAPPASEQQPPRQARPAPDAPRAANEPSPQQATEPAKPTESGDAKAAAGKSVFDTLEEEMANLLGRTGKT